MGKRKPDCEIPRLRWENRWISSLGALRPCARHAGVEPKVPWMYGVTGYAFLLNIHDELCPSGWHVVDLAMSELVSNLGVDVSPMTAGHEFPEPAELDERRWEVWEAYRHAIDAGLACFGYDFIIGDYYVVYGYDDIGYYVSGPQATPDKLPVPWDSYGECGDVPRLLCLTAVTPGEAPADEKAIRDALRFAVDHARDSDEEDSRYRRGLAAYDAWRTALEKADPKGWGPAYNAACYLECRQFAGPFLEDARRRLPREFAKPLGVAVEAYRETTNALRRIAEQFPTDQQEAAAVEPDLELAAMALSEAQQAETEAIDQLEEVLAIMKA